MDLTVQHDRHEKKQKQFTLTQNNQSINTLNTHIQEKRINKSTVTAAETHTKHRVNCNNVTPGSDFRQTQSLRIK